jgi:hypothetical protein
MTEIERFAGPEVKKMIVGNKCDDLWMEEEEEYEEEEEEEECYDSESSIKSY